MGILAVEKKLRDKIIRRDKGCLKCGTTNALSVHHIDHNHNNDDLKNLATLCKKCHCFVSTSKQKIYNQSNLYLILHQRYFYKYQDIDNIRKICDIESDEFIWAIFKPFKMGSSDGKPLTADKLRREALPTFLDRKIIKIWR